MKKFKIFATLVLSVAFIGFMASCNDDDDDDEVIVIDITQEQLDAAINPIMLDLTGGNFEHGGPIADPDSTYRDIFGSVTNLPTDVPPGTIITKKTWMAEDGMKTDQLYVSFAMVKREAGYDPENENWEYIMLPYDETNDYSMHPFGQLEGSNRGKLQGCIDCHAKAGSGDYLFVND